MADATDLKSVGPLKARAGSSPAIGNSIEERESLNRYIGNRITPDESRTTISQLMFIF